MYNSFRCGDDRGQWVYNRWALPRSRLGRPQRHTVISVVDSEDDRETCGRTSCGRTSCGKDISFEHLPGQVVASHHVYAQRGPHLRRTITHYYCLTISLSQVVSFCVGHPACSQSHNSGLPCAKVAFMRLGRPAVAIAGFGLAVRWIVRCKLDV